MVHAIIARPGRDGAPKGKTWVVPLETAYVAVQAGFWAVGPDPDDLIALALWEREHQHD